MAGMPGNGNDEQDGSVKYPAHVMLTVQPRKAGGGRGKTGSMGPAETVAPGQDRRWWTPYGSMRRKNSGESSKSALELKGRQASWQVELNQEGPYEPHQTHYFSKEEHLNVFFV